MNDSTFLKSKVEKLNLSMEKFELDGLVLGNWDNIRYATGLRWIPVIQSKAGSVFFVAIVPRDEQPVLIVSRGDYERAKTDYEIADVRMYESGIQNLENEIYKVFHDYDLSKKTIGIDDDYFPASIYNRILSHFPEAKFLSSKSALAQARRNKLPQEIEYMRKATEITEDSIQKAFEIAKPGLTESELSAIAHYTALHEGAEAILNVIVASGKNSGRKHYQRFATDKKLQQGEFLLIDMSTIYEGYLSDITRTIVLGKPSQEQSRIIEIVEKAFEVGVDTAMPGIEAWKVDEAMRSTVGEAGFEDNYELTMWPAHGIGLSHFEDPMISSRSGFRDVTKLEPNMTLALEPGIYMDDGGYRKENVIAVSNGSAQRLSKLA